MFEKLKESHDIFNTQIDPADRHRLPSDLIKSRLCHAVIWELFGLKSDTTRILILLSRHSRAFILTQRLNGFLLDHHVCTESWLFEFQTSEKFRTQTTCEITELEQVEDALKMLNDKKIKDNMRQFYLRKNFPSVYVA